MYDSTSKGSFRHVGENSRQGKVIFIMRFPYGNALPIKALSLLVAKCTSSLIINIFILIVFLYNSKYDNENTSKS